MAKKMPGIDLSKARSMMGEPYDATNSKPLFTVR